MTPDLTISIPTFDRPEPLRRCLTALLPQLSARVRLIVLDNASEVPAESVAAPLLAAYPAADVRFVRHRYNIGGDANVLRAIEAAASDWVWVLGDDDPPLPDAVARVLSDTAARRDAFWINYSSELHRRPATFTTTGLREFVERMDSFGAAVFISSSLFNVPHLAPGMRWAARRAYSMAPHIGALLAALTPAGECVFSSDQLVSYAHRSRAQAWSVLNFAMGVMTVADGLREHDLRVALARKVLPTLPTLGMVLEDMVGRAAAGWADAGTCAHLMDQLCSRAYAFQPGVGPAVKRLAARALVRCPRLTRRGIRTYRRARRQVWDGQLEGRDSGRE